MEILINELSLNGQFKNEDDFLDNLDFILKIIKLIEKLSFSILKEGGFFNSQITLNYKLNDFLKLRSDRVRKMKSFLANLSNNPPFWNITQKHSLSDTYLYNSQNVNKTSLAESCERDRVVLSFRHNNFLNENFKVQKNGITVDIYNIIKINNFINYLFSNNKILPLDYCLLNFENSNLNFIKLEEKYGFNILNSTQTKEFMNSFEIFSKMSWEDIKNSDSLEYKGYKPNKKNNWFKNSEFINEEIYKFRVSQKYRCFGYRKNDEFFVLRFELDHKISDKG